MLGNLEFRPHGYILQPATRSCKTPNQLRNDEKSLDKAIFGRSQELFRGPYIWMLHHDVA